MKEYLDACLEKYFNEILSEKEFKKSDPLFSGMGAYYEFKNNDLKFMIVNDRGIIEISISSVHSKNSFSFELINAFFYEALGASLKIVDNILSKRLDFKAIKDLFLEKYETLKVVFSKVNHRKADDKLSALGNKRAALLFGNKK